MKRRQPVIFCDFDGTITENDNIVEIMKHFNPPGWQQIAEQVLGKTMPIQDGVGRMFALLPSSRKDEIIRFALDNARIRSGFRELLEYARDHDFKFMVTSGGIDFFVYPLLAPFELKPEQIYCNGSDFSGDTIQILWPHPCDEACENGGCGMCKTAIIRRYPRERYLRILIGDSVTDFAGAKLADVIFARSHLAEECRALGMEYIPYETFHDVIRGLQSIQDTKEVTKG